jgi:hypothetical protein
MKLTENFDLREFVSQVTWNKWGTNSLWFIDLRLVYFFQSFKLYLIRHFQISDSNVVNVLITINNWNTGGVRQWSGYRPPIFYRTGDGKKNPDTESLHRQGKAGDCIITIVYRNGMRRVVPMAEIHDIIMKNQSVFWHMGLRRIESLKDAPTWLHADIAETGLDWQDKIMVVNAA